MRAATPTGLDRRVPWLLVFRAAIATVLLGFALLLDLREWPLGRTVRLLYGVVIGNYLIVVALGLLVRARGSGVAVAAAYLGLAVASAVFSVQATGVADSALTFLYLLAILDGAIIGGRRIALVVAAASAVLYGGQLVLQIYGVLPAGRVVTLPDWEASIAAVVNLSAFYIVAFLAGHLAELLRRARQAAWRAEDDLVRAEALHASILGALPIGVVAVDAHGLVRTANRAALDILRLPEHELAGSTLPPALADALPDRGTARVVTLLLGGRERVLGVVRSAAGLAPGAADDERGPAVSGGGALELLVIEDRTALAELERQLAMRERLASIGELAAAIAHEIRNPLAAISGSLELLLADEPDVDVGSRGALRDIVLREVERLDRLVAEFLLFARPTPIERSRVDVAALARDLCAVLRADGSVGDTAVEVHAPERLWAEVDAEKVRQLLWNLLRNAIEASAGRTPVEMRAHEDGGRLVIEVRDHGPGLDAAIRSHLFEPFRTTKRNGTGLGLAVVHRIVENHGGTIELADAPGGGTAARVVLPPAPALSAATA